MKLLVTGAWNCTSEQLDTLSSIGNDILFLQNETDSLPCDACDIEGVICNGLFLHHDISKFTNLKYIQLTSAGFDRAPMDYIKENGITIHNAKGVYSIPMAEYALMGVLSIYKNISFFLENQKNHDWIKNRKLIELYGKNALIVGCGNVGGECAKRFFALGMKVSGADIINPSWEYGGQFYFMNDIETALKNADVVVLTLPLTDKTYHLFDEKLLGCLKETSVLVNVSRGAVIDMPALEKTLIRGKLTGAVLDVFEQEPLEKVSPLWDMKNVIITPHNSFVSEANGQRLYDVILKNLQSRSEK